MTRLLTNSTTGPSPRRKSKNFAPQRRRFVAALPPYPHRSSTLDASSVSPNKPYPTAVFPRGSRLSADLRIELRRGICASLSSPTAKANPCRFWHRQAFTRWLLRTRHPPPWTGYSSCWRAIRFRPNATCSACWLKQGSSRPNVLKLQTVDPRRRTPTT